MSASQSPFPRILVGLDLPAAATDKWQALQAGREELPEPSRRALAYAKRLAGDGELLLMHAPPSLADAAVFASSEGLWAPREPLDTIDEKASDRSRELLSVIAQRYELGDDVVVQAEAGSPQRVLVDHAGQFGANAIVLATSGHGRVARFFLGSTVDHVIRHSPCPVVAIPAEHPREVPADGPVFRSVVVPIDFEAGVPRHPEREQVIELGKGEHATITRWTAEALRLAASLTDGVLQLVHATPELGGVMRYGSSQAGWLPVELATKAEGQAIEQSLHVMQAIASQVCPEAKVEPHAASGSAEHVVLAAAEHRKADAIVMAASGHGAMRRALGSVADKVIRAASCPVIVVPAAD